MIDYELAKELRVGGFRMDEVVVPMEFAGLYVHGAFEHESKMWRIPTLSELIEACGERFKELKLLPNSMWMAVGSKEVGEVGPFDEDNLKIVEVQNKDRDTAVANLYLALNAK